MSQEEDSRLIDLAADSLFVFVREIAEHGYECLDDVCKEAEELIHNLGLVGVRDRRWWKEKERGDGWKKITETHWEKP